MVQDGYFIRSKIPTVLDMREAEVKRLKAIAAKARMWQEQLNEAHIAFQKGKREDNLTIISRVLQEIRDADLGGE